MTSTRRHLLLLAARRPVGADPHRHGHGRRSGRDRHRRQDRRHPLVQRHGGGHPEGGQGAGRQRVDDRPDAEPMPPQQVRAVEDLIARKVDVIAVVPNDAVALEPVFKRAQEAGIKVLTHESPDQKFNDWNVELTSVAGLRRAAHGGAGQGDGRRGRVHRLCRLADRAAAQQVGRRARSRCRRRSTRR